MFLAGRCRRGAAGGRRRASVGAVVLSRGSPQAAGRLRAVVRHANSAGEGVAVTASQQPRLWSLVDDVAEAMDTRPLDELRVTSGPNASVSESGAVLGLRRGQRRMVLGLALLDVLDVDGLRSVVAHELGHHAVADTRLGPLHFRAGALMGRAIERLDADTTFGRVLSVNARLYLRASLTVRRRQELAADAAAVRLAGRDAHMRALVAAASAAVAYGTFIDHYVAPLWDAGRRPRNLHDGFRRLWAATGDNPKLLTAIDEALGRHPHPLDSHPSLSRRLSAARGLPDAARTRDPAPARTLLDDPERLEEAVTRELSARHTPLAEPLEWEDAADAVFRPAFAARARNLLEEVARLDGGPAPADLARLLAVLETHGVPALAAHGDPRAVVTAGAVRAAIGSALVDAGARWRLSWESRMALDAADGRAFDLDAVVRRAVDEPPRMAEVRDVLAAEGVAGAWTPSAMPAPDAPRPGSST